MPAIFSVPASVRLQYFLPKRLLTQLAGRLAKIQGGWVTQQVIRWFIDKYKVNMNEALNPDPASYATFNDFFTRALKPGARPLENAHWICPVDGAISQFGVIDAGQIYQAKGHNYSTRALLGGNQTLASHFQNGHFACLYLSPKDYHRIHMPCAGVLRQMTYVPGDLFSVNPTTAGAVPGLFARNERLICVFDTPYGTFVLVLVGATIVGSMATVWHGIVNPPRLPNICTWHYPTKGESGAVALEQGAEMGRFLLGSTVVMLWSQTDLLFNAQWQPAKSICMGQAMANASA